MALHVLHPGTLARPVVRTIPKLHVQSTNHILVLIELSFLFVRFFCAVSAVTSTGRRRWSRGKEGTGELLLGPLFDLPISQHTVMSPDNSVQEQKDRARRTWMRRLLNNCASRRVRQMIIGWSVVTDRRSKAPDAGHRLAIARTRNGTRTRAMIELLRVWNVWW